MLTRKFSNYLSATKIICTKLIPTYIKFAYVWYKRQVIINSTGWCGSYKENYPEKLEAFDNDIYFIFADTVWITEDNIKELIFVNPKQIANDMISTMYKYAYPPVYDVFDKSRKDKINFDEHYLPDEISTILLNDAKRLMRKIHEDCPANMNGLGMVYLSSPSSNIHEVSNNIGEDIYYDYETNAPLFMRTVHTSSTAILDTIHDVGVRYNATSCEIGPGIRNMIINGDLDYKNDELMYFGMIIKTVNKTDLQNTIVRFITPSGYKYVYLSISI